MKLKKLIKDIPIHDVKGSRDVEITGVCTNSKLVAPGNLFIAKKGHSSDGTQYIPEAIEAGAVAVVTDMFDPFQKQATQLIDLDIDRLETEIAAAYYQNPSQELFTVGVTGTNGKTTTAYWVKHLLDQIHGPTGLMGTIEYLIGNHSYQATHTTPDLCTNQKMLREMVTQQCRSAVMEVSSHALDQKRVAGIDYDVAIFTNLTDEHLDYHKTMQEYCAAKRKLFLSLKEEATAVINKDDMWENRIAEGCRAKRLTYSIRKKADLKASRVRFSPSGTRFDLSYLDQKVSIHWPHVGRYNIYNCMATIAVGLTLGHTLERLADCMVAAPAVPGRLESVPNNLGIQVYVDYAHTDDSLANVLGCLQELAEGRIITVFGCGGNRDRGKRSRMARVAEELSDFCIVTTDNPRKEDPLIICDEICSAFEKKNHAVEPDRRRAIALAIDMAKAGDVILIAGKGHETTQIFAHQTYHFDDRQVAEELCHANAEVIL